MIDAYIAALAAYAEHNGLLEAGDHWYGINALLEALGLDSYTEPAELPALPLEEVLDRLVEFAREKGLCGEGITEHDLFDTKLMGCLTQRPSQVNGCLWQLYAGDPQRATDWYYAFSQATNYIRRDRIAKDQKWLADTAYGPMEITINLSKPEKDPKAIAAARLKAPSGYPKCLLCQENEGYAGRADHPARQNHRLLALELLGEAWAMQYSPYVYYNEHCIFLNRQHRPMKIDRAAFEKLLAIVEQFPHYFVGSNADLPIVGGSILSHEHFQGGRHTFAMETAPVERGFAVPGYEGVRARVVRWPMSVIRLTGARRGELAGLADHILTAWRAYSDEAAGIYAETGGEAHNTITPIARRRGADYELDLVLRNNRTTEEYPMGVFHPHQELHHIKKENIGLIEVMGLAVLPARLKGELEAVAAALVSGADLEADPATALHAEWARQVKARHPELCAANAAAILQAEVGSVFATVLEHAGVYKRSAEGQAAFDRFIASL